MSERIGVLLMTYGSPADDLHDLPRYLAAVRGGREPSVELVGEFRRRYELIGGSPLIPITRAQAASVEAQMRRDGDDARAAVGMRFSAPTIEDGLRELAELGCLRVAAIVMSPQYSELLMAGYRRALDGAREVLGPLAPSRRGGRRTRIRGTAAGDRRSGGLGCRPGSGEMVLLLAVRRP